MTRNTTSYREKGRAVVLAALMVLSVVAMSAAFAGSVAASDLNESIDNGDTFWEGEELTFDEVAGNSIENMSEVTVWNEDGGVAKELNVDGDGHATLDTGALGTGSFTVENPGGDAVEITISEQSLTASPVSESVSQGDSAQVDLESARNGYNMTLTADGISTSDLAAATGGSDKGDYVLFTDVSSSDSISIDTSDIATGSYNFSVGVTDTSAEASFSLEVVEPGTTSVSFEENVPSTTIGDHNTVTVNFNNAEEAYLDLTWTPEGSDTTYTILNGTVTPNSDGQAVIDVNTHALLNTSEANLNDGDLYTEVEGGFTADYAHDFGSQQHDVWDWTNSFNMELSVGDQRHDRGTFRVTDRATNDISTSISLTDSIEDLDDMGVAADGSVANGDVVAVEIDANGLFGYADSLDELEENGVYLTLTHTNPGFDGDAVQFSPSNYYVSEDEERIVAFFDTSSQDNVTAGQNYDVTFTVNADADSTTYDNVNPYTDETETFTDSFTVEQRTLAFDSDQFSVSADSGQQITGTSNAAPGAQISVEAEAGGDHPFYLQTTAEVAEDGTWAAEMDFSGQVKDTEFTITAEELDADIDSITADGIVGEAGKGPYLGITADAPSSVKVDDSASLDVTVTNTGDEKATGTVSITVDGEEVVSEEVELEAGASTDFSEDLDTSSAGDISWEVTTDDESDSGTVTVEEESKDGDDGTDGDDDGTDGDDDGGDGDDGDGQPGFGVAVALVALLSAAMLALRRQN